jgi:hypothetical protein
LEEERKKERRFEGGSKWLIYGEKKRAGKD